MLLYAFPVLNTRHAINLQSGLFLFGLTKVLDTDRCLATKHQKHLMCFKDNCLGLSDIKLARLNNKDSDPFCISQYV